MPAPTAPARETQQQQWFHDTVNTIHERIERIEAEARRRNGI